jgi:hypothetical protein
MVGHQTLNLAIGVRVPASQPLISVVHLTTLLLQIASERRGMKVASKCWRYEPVVECYGADCGSAT